MSGTEAAESAIHLALCHTGRRYIISFTSCFHGEGLGTKMVSAYDSQKNLYMEGLGGGFGGGFHGNALALYPSADFIG